jgi:hypothetical protein
MVVFVYLCVELNRERGMVIYTKIDLGASLMRVKMLET